MGAAEIINVRGVQIRLLQRGDGKWKITWKEAGKWVSTTATLRKTALARADEIGKRLSRAQGGLVVSLQDAEVLDEVRRLAGERSPFVWLAEIAEATRRLGGRVTLAEVVSYYEASGRLSVQRVPWEVARNRILDEYSASGWDTYSTIRKELDAFGRAHKGLVLVDITAELLAAWIGRSRSGAKISAKTWNNRRGLWITALNLCVKWHYLPPGPHVGHGLARRKEADRIPAILTPEQARKALAALPGYLVPTFVIGCFLGPRPRAEIRMIDWAHFDWQGGHLHIPPGVARKTMRERFVPIPANVVALLKPLRRAAGKVSGKDHMERISKTLREAGVIDVWPPDVMRHSYISYQLALGHGIGQVAEWAGTSERKIRQNYRRPLKRADGEEWFRVECSGLAVVGGG